MTVDRKHIHRSPFSAHLIPFHIRIQSWFVRVAQPQYLGSTWDGLDPIEPICSRFHFHSNNGHRDWATKAPHLCSRCPIRRRPERTLPGHSYIALLSSGRRLVRVWLEEFSGKCPQLVRWKLFGTKIGCKLYGNKSVKFINVFVRVDATGNPFRVTNKI